MKATYDLNTEGVLIITADADERLHLAELANESGEFDCNAEYDALESLICNSELAWIAPEEIGALTDAPILGIRGEETEVPPELAEHPFLHISRMQDGKRYYEPVIAAWGFMDYPLRSFIEDLIETGKVTFTGGAV